MCGLAAVIQLYKVVELWSSYWKGQIIQVREIEDVGLACEYPGAKKNPVYLLPANKYGFGKQQMLLLEIIWL